MNVAIGDGLLRTLLLMSVVAGFTIQKADAQTVDLDNFCQSYPANSRCEDYIAENPDSFKQPELPPQVIKIQLETYGSDDELIWLEINQEIIGDITLSAYHMEKTEGLLFSLLNGAVGAAAPIPLPFDLIQTYDSKSNQTEFIAFTPDSCQAQSLQINGQGFPQSNCSITGVDMISLPEDVDIRSGFFTLSYTEGDLLRAITFRISDHDAEFMNEFDLNNLCQRFPLNSQCRYWPISQAESSIDTVNQ